MNFENRQKVADGMLASIAAVGFISAMYTTSAGAAEYRHIDHCASHGQESVAHCAAEAAREHPLPMGNGRLFLAIGSVVGMAGLISRNSKPEQE